MLANLPRRAYAQSESQLYGVQVAKKEVATDAPNKTPDTVFVVADTVTGKETSRISVPSRQVSNLQTDTKLDSVEIDNAQVDNTDASRGVPGKSVLTRTRERITSLTPLTDGTLAVVSVVNTPRGNFTRVAQINPKTGENLGATRISGFETNSSTLESLVATKDNNLIGIASFSDGLPPFKLIGIDLKGGKANNAERLALPTLFPNRRYSNLVLGRDNVIYGTSIGSEGSVVLIKIDLNDRAAITGRAKVTTVVELQLDNKDLENDILSLAISPGGQIYALADPASKGTNSLFIVDEKSGAIRFVRDFQVDKIAFAIA
ncbi:hypothetical protein DSM106972_042090 [Dulcicalothrix desertica PCC 7102]|uniref:Phytase-like domain-containing protein n=1 Tax=Dulcicalothrix desertica PCC 7102 TaxID=232991 RepID=A0A3S1AMG1_9CYAN|nr:hypothetical protein DSM106972_042090 [Dulcicalothrix desertica PCC 7102]